MSWLERKGPFVRHLEKACPKCNGNLVEFDIPVSSILITETYCESCDYTVQDINVVKEIKTL